MANDETGAIQFVLDWQRAPAPGGPLVEDLCRWRNALRSADLIGVLPDGIGFGNLSCRIRATNRFIISGASTGRVIAASASDFVEVTGYDLAANAVSCRGPLPASSESLSHAAVYSAAPHAAAVIHVHHEQLWQRDLPATDRHALAGTPAMAWAIVHLLQHRPATDDTVLFKMGGHVNGLVAFAPTIQCAAEYLLSQVA